MGWLRREVERAHSRAAEEAAAEEARQKAIAEFQSASRKVVAALSSFGDYTLPSWEEEHHGLTVPPIVKTEGLTADVAAAVYLASLNGDADELGKLLAVYLEAPPAAEEGGGEEAEAAAPPPKWQIVDRYGWEPAAIAAAGGHLEALEVLLKAGSDATARNSYSGWGALHRAVEAGHSALIEPLVAAGAAINAPTKDHTAPLHLAAMHGNVEVAKALLAAGAKVDPKDVCESTPLIVAVEVRTRRHFSSYATRPYPPLPRRALPAYARRPTRHHISPKRLVPTPPTSHSSYPWPLRRRATARWSRRCSRRAPPSMPPTRTGTRRCTTRATPSTYRSP